MGFMATIDCFEVEELASKVIPNMSFTLVDPEKLVTPSTTETVFVIAERFRRLDWFAIRLSKRSHSSRRGWKNTQLLWYVAYFHLGQTLVMLIRGSQKQLGNRASCWRPSVLQRRMRLARRIW